MKKLIALFTTFVFAFTLAACDVDDLDVGIVLPTNEEPRWVQDEGRFEEALEDADYSVDILFSDGDIGTERENVESLVNQGIDVLIITPQDGDAAAAAVEEAKAAGVTVISYDRLVTGTDAVDYYVTFDSIAVGEAQGQYLIDNAPEDEGNPLYLYSGAEFDNNSFLFFEGGWNVLQPKIEDGTFDVVNSSEAEDLKDNGDLTREEMSNIMGQIDTEWDFDTARSLAEADLATVDEDQKGDVSILAPNDGTARNIGDVFADDEDITSYNVTGQDAESPSIQYIIDEQQSMTVFKDVRTLVDDAIDMALSVLDGETPQTAGSFDNGVIDVPSAQSDIVTVTRENVREVIFDSGYYDEDDFDNVEDLD